MTSTSVKPLNVVQLANALRDSSHRFDMFETMRLTGWISNGRFQFRAPEALIARILAKRKDKPADPARIVDAARMQTVLAMVADSIPAYATDGDTIEDADGTVYTWARSARPPVKINARYLETIRKYHPDAEMRITFPRRENATPIVSFVASGVIVAILMPMAS